jgi:predicted GNAT family N-acyltransferase
LQIEKLSRAHNRAAFDCGEESLNKFLREFARKNASENLGVTYVLVPAPGDTTILGYYTLVMTEIVSDLMAPENRPPLPSIPAALLGRLATDINHRSAGLGKLLVADCIQRVVRLADEIGVHLIAVDALNEKARAFYQKHFGFQTLADDPHHLYLLVKTAKKALAAPN